MTVARILTASRARLIRSIRGEGRGFSDVCRKLISRWFAEEAKAGLTGDDPPVTCPTRTHQVLRQAGGNRPPPSRPGTSPNLRMITRKAGPALAGGPGLTRWWFASPSLTPLSALALGVLADRAGLAEGHSLDFIPVPRPRPAGKDFLREPRPCGTHLHPGSTEVAASSSRRPPRRSEGVDWKSGGNAPFIVFDDADLGARRFLRVPWPASSGNNGTDPASAPTVILRCMSGCLRRLRRERLGSGTCRPQGRRRAWCEGIRISGPPLIEPHRRFAKVWKTTFSRRPRPRRHPRTGPAERNELGGLFFEPTYPDLASPQDMKIASEGTLRPRGPFSSGSRPRIGRPSIPRETDTNSSASPPSFYPATTRGSPRVEEALRVTWASSGSTPASSSTEVRPLRRRSYSLIGPRGVEGSHHGIRRVLEIGIRSAPPLRRTPERRRPGRRQPPSRAIARPRLDPPN